VKILWGPDGWDDYLHWQEADPKILRQINGLISDIGRHPFEGLGRPEILGRELEGWWSRRITRPHRLVYRILDADDEQLIEIIGCRYHYHRP
jgi:toxin YoeB